MNPIRQYSQRLLNPFRGVMNIIAYEGAEAVTIDGLHWDIYVRDMELVRDLESAQPVQTSEIRYGSWSEQQGLVRGPLYPSDDFKLLEQQGALVYRHLLKHHRHLPFPLADTIEHWLLDHTGQPLALIDSTPDAELIEPGRPIHWRAGQRYQQQFRCRASESPAEQLETLINRRVSNTHPDVWLQRHADGSGTALNDPRQWDREQFPRHVLQDSGEQPDLIRDYLDWLSPYLLLLPHWSVTERRLLEEKAFKQALIIEQQFRLYPEVLDRPALDAARVEAQLRQRLEDTEEGEEVMSTFYIEINNITRTN